MHDMEHQEFRDAGHRLVDLLAAYIADVQDRAIIPDVTPEDLAERFDEPIPKSGAPLREVLDRLERDLLPFCTHVSHPGYMGLITPSPAPAGILGDFIAAALNQNIGVQSIGPSAVALERRTVRWLTDLVGWDAAADGNLTSGGTMANFIGLKLGRDAASGQRAQHDGVEGGRWAAYVSDERHISVDKAADAVGLGRRHLRIIPSDERFRIRLDALEQAIAADRDQGIQAACIVAMCGSTNTGAVDDLRALRRIADREGAWLHVDAAYGGGMLLSRDRDLVTNMRLGDSITLDPHKWFYAPVDAGAILVRDARHLLDSFGMRPAYLTDEVDERGYDYYVHGFEQSRRFRALKVWMSFQRYGTEEIGRWIDANVAQARRLHELAIEREHFRPAVAPTMSAICLRYEPPGLDEPAIAALHHRVTNAIQREGRFWFGTTVLKDRAWFRINPVNFRTRIEHMDELMDALERHCRAALGAVGASRA